MYAVVKRFAQAKGVKVHFAQAQVILIHVVLALNLTYAFAQAPGAHSAAVLARPAANPNAGASAHPRPDISQALQEAFNKSWQGKQSEAQEKFLSVLQESPSNQQALIGLGYSYAWSGDFEKSRQQFEKVLAADPANQEAHKGLAYSALWSGQPGVAAARFQQLADSYPEQTEYALALGQSRLAGHQRAQAKGAFNQARRAAPNSREAREGLMAVHELPAQLEIDFWAGFTRITGVNETGVRLAEIAIWPSDQTRLWARYDNTLSLDNLALRQLDENVPTYSVGAFSSWHPKFTTLVEVGSRNLPSGVDQRLVRLEQTYLLPNRLALKAGGMAGPRDDDRTEWLLYGGLSIPVGKTLRVEPTYFYSDFALFDTREHRFLVTGKYRFSNAWRVSCGMAVGDINSQRAEFSGGIFSGHIMLAAPVGLSHWGYFMYRFESPVEDSYSVIAAGIRIGIDK